MAESNGLGPGSCGEVLGDDGDGDAAVAAPVGAVRGVESKPVVDSVSGCSAEDGAAAAPSSEDELSSEDPGDDEGRDEEEVDENEESEAVGDGASVERLEQINTFLTHLAEHQPAAIPDALVMEVMRECGAAHCHPNVVRLISLATHKYILDIVNDTLQASKLKLALQKHLRTKDKRYVLTMDDLAPVLKEYGINVTHPPYYT